jgi:site-specific DNA-methyltransferase (adenine-specific)
MKKAKIGGRVEIIKMTTKNLKKLKEVKPSTIYQGDCIEVMKQWKEGIFDCCITDPPYNMSKKNGLGWAFSKHVTMQEEWDRFSQDDYYKFTRDWLEQVIRVVKPNGNIFIFGSSHNIYLIGFLLQSVFSRKIINSIVWFKPNAQPNITARMFTESSEFIIWACNNTLEKAKGWYFDYAKSKDFNHGNQLRNVWKIDNYEQSNDTRVSEDYPTLKPMTVLERIILTASKPKDWILDCFGGADRTAMLAQKSHRRWTMMLHKPTECAV